MVKRIRIFFINCPTLATDAASFLILAQNKVQTFVQYEVHHFHIYAKKTIGGSSNWWNRTLVAIEDKYEHRLPRLVSQRLARRNSTYFDRLAAPTFCEDFTGQRWFDDIKKVVGEYDAWVQQRGAKGQNNLDSQYAPSIVITETNLEDHFVSWAEGDLAVISAAEWKRFFKPGSALEYILTGVQRATLYLGAGMWQIAHYPTRGCLCDYGINVPDLRISAFRGFLCETCRSFLKEKLSTAEYDDVFKLIDNQWIGDKDTPSSVAAILAKHYRYDLTRSTGLRPGFLATVLASMQSELGKKLSAGVIYAFLILALLIVVRYFPSLWNFIGSVLTRLGHLP